MILHCLVRPGKGGRHPREAESRNAKDDCVLNLTRGSRGIESSLDVRPYRAFRANRRGHAWLNKRPHIWFERSFARCCFS